MQRTKTTRIEDPNNKQIKWKNYGGPFYKDGKRIPTGETFYATVDEIPSAFRDVIRPVDPLDLTVEKPLKPVKSSFHLKQRKATSFYDVYDGNNKRINEKDLSEEDAKHVLSMLT